MPPVVTPHIIVPLAGLRYRRICSTTQNYQVAPPI